MRAPAAPHLRSINLNRLCPPRHRFDIRALSAGTGRSKRIPSGTVGEFEVAEIGTKPKTDAGTDRHHGDMVGYQRRHAETANKIGRSVDAAEAVEDRLGPRQVIDQHHGARAVGAGIEADAGPLPKHAQIAGVLCIKRAVAVAQAANKGAAGFLTENIAIWFPPLADRLLDHHGKPARYPPEEAMSGFDQFVR